MGGLLPEPLLIAMTHQFGSLELTLVIGSLRMSVTKETFLDAMSTQHTLAPGSEGSQVTH